MPKLELTSHEKCKKPVHLLKGIIATALVAVLALVPFYNMVIVGPYNWHIQQPQSWQGMLVLLGFLAVSFVLAWWFPKNAPLSVGLLALLYLSINGVVVPFLAAGLYVAVLCLLGSTVLSFRRDTLETDWVKCFLAGIGVWGAFAIIASLLGFGGFNDLRVLTVALGLLALVLAGKKSIYPLFTRPLHWLRKATNQPLTLFFCLAVLYVLLALMAKSNTALDYDSFWYGLRPEHVLVGEHSFYDNLGFAGFIYYYPKLMEVLFLPISNLGDNSFIVIANVFVLFFLLLAVTQACRRFFSMSTHWAAGFALLLATVPAIAGVASTAKPDILGDLLVFCAWMYFYEYIQKGMLSSLVYTVLCLALCTGTKPTYLLWGGLVFIALLPALFLRWRQRAGRPVKQAWRAAAPELAVMGLGAIFVLGVHLRTYLITGFPFYPTGLSIFTKLGFSARYPFTNEYTLIGDPPQGFADALSRVYHLFIDPRPFGGIVMLWVSNLLLCLLVLWLVYYKKQPRQDRAGGNWPLSVYNACVCLLMIVFMLYFHITGPGNGGNYYIVPVLLVCIYLAGGLARRSQIVGAGVPKPVLAVATALLLLTQFPLMVTTHPSWAGGIQAFSMEVAKDNFETPTANAAVLENNGYAKAAAYIEEELGNGMVLTSNCEYTLIARIDGAIQSRQDLDAYFASTQIYESYDGFERYLHYADVRAFLVDHEDQTIFKDYCLQYVEQAGASAVIEDEAATLYVL